MSPVRSARGNSWTWPSNPTVTGNTVHAGARAIVVGRGTAPVISGNTICGGQESIYVEDGADSQLGDNEVCADAAAE